MLENRKGSLNLLGQICYDERCKWMIHQLLLWVKPEKTTDE